MTQKQFNFLIRAGTVFLVVLAIGMMAWDIASSKRHFVGDFNQNVPLSLQQSSQKDIKALANYRHLSAEEWAFLWIFTDKYDIGQMPASSNDPKDANSSARMYQKLVALDEYIQSEITAGRLSKQSASKLLNKIFAASNQDFIAMAQAG